MAQYRVLNRSFIGGRLVGLGDIVDLDPANVGPEDAHLELVKDAEPEVELVPEQPEVPVVPEHEQPNPIEGLGHLEGQTVQVLPPVPESEHEPAVVPEHVEVPIIPVQPPLPEVEQPVSEPPVVPVAETPEAGHSA